MDSMLNPQGVERGTSFRAKILTFSLLFSPGASQIYCFIHILFVQVFQGFLSFSKGNLFRKFLSLFAGFLDLFSGSYIFQTLF